MNKLSKLNKLNKTELLELKNGINDQLETLNQNRKELENMKSKNKLSQLAKPGCKLDKIFCINFSGDKIYNIDYVNISFHKKDDENLIGWTNFSTSHGTKPLGCSSSLRDKNMSKHYFISEFSSSMYFFTLKPKNWEKDLNKSIKNLIKLKKKSFDEGIKIIRKKSKFLIKNQRKINQFIK